MSGSNKSVAAGVACAEVSTDQDANAVNRCVRDTRFRMHGPEETRNIAAAEACRNAKAPAWVADNAAKRERMIASLCGGELWQPGESLSTVYTRLLLDPTLDSISCIAMGPEQFDSVEAIFADGSGISLHGPGRVKAVDVHGGGRALALATRGALLPGGDLAAQVENLLNEDGSHDGKTGKTTWDEDEACPNASRLTKVKAGTESETLHTVFAPAASEEFTSVAMACPTEIIPRSGPGGLAVGTTVVPKGYTRNTSASVFGPIRPLGPNPAVLTYSRGVEGQAGFVALGYCRGKLVRGHEVFRADDVPFTTLRQRLGPAQVAYSGRTSTALRKQGRVWWGRILPPSQIPESGDWEATAASLHLSRDGATAVLEWFWPHLIPSDGCFGASGD